MRNNILLLLLITPFTLVMGQSGKTPDDKAFELSLLYSKGTSSKHLLAFFEAFPSTFADYRSIFGSQGRLSAQAVSYNERYMLAGRQTDKSRFYAKNIGLTTGGSHEQGGISDLQNVLLQSLSKDPEGYFQALTKVDDNTLKNFWSFLFDHNYAAAKTMEKFEGLSKKYSREYTAMKWANMTRGMELRE